MKFSVKIDGNLHNLEAEKEGKEITFILKDKKYSAEIKESAPGLFSVLLEDGKQREILAHKLVDNSYNFYINAKEYPIKIQDFLAMKVEKFKKEEKKLAGWVLKAQIPGKIVKILKKEGEFVKKDEGILIIEAMKMQNEIKAPEKGKIKKIYYKEMEVVETGFLLIEALAI